MVFLDGYCISWHRFYNGFHVRVVVSNIRLLSYSVVARLDTLCQCEKSQNQYQTQVWGEIVETILSTVWPHDVESFCISNKNLRWHRKLYVVDVVPYASLSCLWGLAVYGLVTFNYGNLGSELFYGSIISFLLIYLSNLTFAIFCALVVDLSLKWAFYCWWSYGYWGWDDILTKWVSMIFQKRISFPYGFHSLYLPKEKELTLICNHVTHEVKVMLFVFFAIDNGWRYGVHRNSWSW